MKLIDACLVGQGQDKTLVARHVERSYTIHGQLRHIDFLFRSGEPEMACQTLSRHYSDVEFIQRAALHRRRFPPRAACTVTAAITALLLTPAPRRPACLVAR